MMIFALGSPKPDDHHLRPFKTISSPSMTAVACILVASLEATSGSVIQNTERILPSSKGLNHCCFCASEPYRHNTSMLPLSGALQLNTVGAIKLRPVSSAICAYSCTDKPCPNTG